MQPKLMNWRGKLMGTSFQGTGIREGCMQNVVICKQRDSLWSKESR